jgi:hypothetical protein
MAAVFLGASGSARAQTATSGDSVHAAPLFTYRDAALAAGFAGLTVAMFPLDKSVARRLQNPTVQSNRFFTNGATDLRLVADPGGLIAGFSAYGVGRVAGWKNVADLGLHTVEALSMAGLTTVILDGLVSPVSRACTTTGTGRATSSPARRSGRSPASKSCATIIPARRT